MAEIRESAASIVMVGRLNPLIFQPEWLRANLIIGQGEADAAREGGIEVIHPDLTSINLARMKLVVETQRFAITAQEEPLVRARDFAVNCFRLVPHTPATMLGINFTVIFRAKDIPSWHRFGDELAPKAPWISLLGENHSPDKGGMKSLVMERSARADGRPGFVRVTVEAVEGGVPDTKISVNDHYQLAQDQASTAEEAAKLIEEVWETSQASAQEISAKLMAIADGL